MITNNQIKFVKSLHQSKFRQKYNNFIAEGDKIAQEILQNTVYNFIHIVATDDWLETNAFRIEKYRHKCITVSSLEMSKISALRNPSPVLCVLEKKSQKIDKLTVNEGHAIFLDNVQDPGNLGTIIRIADWFGIKSVIRNEGSADFYHPKVVQATMGSFLGVGLYKSEFDELNLKNHKSVGAVMHGDSLSSFGWPDKTLLIMGNEGKGISAPIHQVLDYHVTIPGSEGRVADSLNVGMATGILCASLFG